jgi:hypothetical protein
MRSWRYPMVGDALVPSWREVSFSQWLGSDKDVSLPIVPVVLNSIRSFVTIHKRDTSCHLTLYMSVFYSSFNVG